MAKKGKVTAAVSANPMIAALQNIQATGRVSQADGLPLLEHNPRLIDVDTNDVVNGLAAARLTSDGAAMLSVPMQASQPIMNGFAAITGFVPPESKRGFAKGERKSKYDFGGMATGASFFVPATAEMENPLKTLGSTVSNATNKYRVDTGQTKQVERTQRGPGNKAVLDAQGNKVKENVQVPVYNYPRKFVIRGVVKGTKYGEWVAPENGAVITRTV